MLERTGAKIFVTWLGPFSPLISVCHPDTAKLLFKSSEPKSVFKPPGVYYFIKSWLADPQQLDKRHLDFLDILITAKDSDGSGLTDEDIRAEVDTFLFEGHDTTASAISWAAYYLGKHPEEQQKVYEEVKNITNCEDNFTWENINNCPRLALFLKEAMRQSSPVPIIARQLRKPFEFDGFEIPAGMAVGIWIYHVNNHPNVWPDNEV
ncbi:hypothetical protein FSP39_005566 [Pinctada imbricata]|uniref:Uncharacterized protein n=1 Tax=Pinctada imbricata TaxID=66713 RepID=A0AA89BK13_PINIB|nr:hypothetical protein FSP39_005566 [Pinctada imbricata]